jgi:acetyltransferase-like isoleucine patch superfamily enzyme
MQSANVLQALSRWPRLKSFVVISFEAIARLLFALPRYALLNSVKAAFLRLNGARIGARVVFYPGVWIAPGRGLTLSDDVDLALDVYIETSGGVEIGARVLVGPRTCIFSANHSVPLGRGRIFGAGRADAPVVIGDDVWLGANVIVLPGVRIGEGAVIGAGSVVTRSIPAMTVAVGNPARVLRERR